MKKRKGVGRREILASVGAAGALGATTRLRDGVAGRHSARSPVRGRPARPAAAGREVRTLFGELGAGAEIGTCRIVAVYDVSFGAIPVVLEDTAGRRFQVDVLRSGALDAGAPVASTRSLALFLSNRGDGERPTLEEQGLAAMALARALDAREATGARAPALLTFAERRRTHPAGAYVVLA